MAAYMPLVYTQVRFPLRIQSRAYGMVSPKVGWVLPHQLTRAPLQMCSESSLV